ncbi:MAG: mechanosensitive ion channel domain-containing protein [Sulfitobacter sp.]
MRFLFWLLASVMLFLGAASHDVAAQGLGSLIPKPQETTPDEPEAALSPLEKILEQAATRGVGIVVVDAEGTLLGQTSAAAPGAPLGQSGADAGSPLMKAQEDVVQFRDALKQQVKRLPSALNEVIFILRASSPTGKITSFFQAFAYAMMLFAVGVVVEHWVYGRLIGRRYIQPLVKQDPQGYAEKMPFLTYRFLFGVGGILVSMAVAYVLGAVFFGPIEDSAMRFTITLVNIGYFGCRFVAGLWRMILSPYLPQYRIPALGDREAKRLHRWLWMIGCLDIFAILLGHWLKQLALNYEVYALMAISLSAISVLANISLVVVNRSAVSRALRGNKDLRDCSWVTRKLVRFWAPAVVFYVLFAWTEVTRDLVLETPNSIPLIAGAYAVLLSIIVVYGLINYVIEIGFARRRALRLLKAQVALDAAQSDIEAAPTLHQDMDVEEEMALALEDEAPHPHHSALNSYEDLARRVAGILAFVAGTYAFLYIWNNESARMVEGLSDRALDIMAICFIGYVVFHAFRIWIDTKIAEESPEEEEAELGDEGGGSSASRLATLLPLFRNAVLIVVVVSIGLIVLMELGVNVGPLFAGAGIVGIAIGFGSQALVRDIFAGAFFLFDDAFRKGEYLDVGGIKGTVEKISVRSFQLRHHLGALHTMPFGEIQVMTNYSRDWVVMKLPLRVTYDTDVEKVRKMIKKLGQDLLLDPEIGENFIQPLKSQGVIEMQDSAMIIRVKFMTKPGDQWVIRKKVFAEIRALFEQEGIKFAHREVTVRLADGKVDDLTPAQKSEVAAAAHAALDEDVQDAADTQASDDR